MHPPPPLRYTLYTPPATRTLVTYMTWSTPMLCFDTSLVALGKYGLMLSTRYRSRSVDVPTTYDVNSSHYVKKTNRETMRREKL
jgi:hypothetical protein